MIHDGEWSRLLSVEPVNSGAVRSLCPPH
jgi:hypothetical protein